jgi:hypothetical protein
MLTLYFLLTFSRTKFTVVLHVPTKQIRDFSIYTVSNVSRISPSTRYVTAANSICKSPDVFNTHITSIEDNFPWLNPTELRYYRVTCITLLPSIKF